MSEFYSDHEVCVCGDRRNRCTCLNSWDIKKASCAHFQHEGFEEDLLSAGCSRRRLDAEMEVLFLSSCGDILSVYFACGPLSVVPNR